MRKLATLRTAGGLTILLREATAEDRQLLIDGFASLSSESRHARFFTELPKLSNAMVDQLLDLGDRDHLAIVAFDPTTEADFAPPVGAVQLIKSTYARSGFEFALTILDAYQRLGIGSALVAAIGATAHHLGIANISAELLTTNRGMRRLLTNFSADIRPDGADATVLHAELSTAAAAGRLLSTESHEISALFDHLVEDGKDL